MAPRVTRYTLVGFSADLDWRPLDFVEPLPEHTACSACGLVRKRTAFLPCIHALCNACCEQITQDGALTCPRDGRRCEVQDVDWKDFPPEDLLTKLVKCWNAESGCTRVMTASEICTHMEHECEHHSTCCPVCSNTALCKDICAHLNSGCAKRATPSTSHIEEPSRCMDVADFFISFKVIFEAVAGEMKTFLGRLGNDAKVKCSRLGNLSHSISNVTEAVGQISDSVEIFKEYFQATSKSIDENVEKVTESPARELRALEEELRNKFRELRDERDSLTEAMRELTVSTADTEGSLVSKLDRLMELLNNARSSSEDKSQRKNGSSQNREILPRISPSTGAIERGGKVNAEEMFDQHHESQVLPELNMFSKAFFLKGVSSLAERALKEGFDCYDSQRVYLRGYCLTPGVCAMKATDTVAFHIGIQLHKGDMDDIVQWPFQQKIKMTVIHPNGHDELALEVRDSCHLGLMQRPSKSNDPCYYPALSLNLKKMISHGYVESDQLLLMFELLP